MTARPPASDAERREAKDLARRLEDLGREAEIQSIEVWPAYPLAHSIHAALGIAGSVVAVSSPIAGTALALAAVLLTFGDLTGLFMLTRRLTGRRASQNVVSPEEGGKPGTLVLVAHYDSGRALDDRRPAIFFWSMVLVLACCIVRVAGVEGTVLTAIQFVPTVVLLVSIPLLLDVALSGAPENGNGVDTALQLAERYGGRLDHFQVWVLFTGSQKGFALGMRAFLKRHRLPKDATVLVSLEGGEEVRYSRREGPLLTLRSHVQLVEICDEIAEDDDDGAFDARGRVGREPSDGFAARMRGYPAITVSGDVGFCSELVERLDAGIGPDLEPGSSERPVPAR